MAKSKQKRFCLPLSSDQLAIEHVERSKGVKKTNKARSLGGKNMKNLNGNSNHQ